MDAVEIIPPDGPINATVRPPGSKSITNRALPIAAVANGTSTLTGVLKSDDTIYMIKALKQLGVEIDDSRLSDIPQESVVVVHGCDGRFSATEADLFLGNSGTSIRFLTAMVAAAGRGTYRLDGIERMRERPIGDLVDALRKLDVEIDYESSVGFPPLIVRTHGFDHDGPVAAVDVRSDTSSQFLSAVLMATNVVAYEWAVYADQEFSSVSDSYTDMTLRVMSSFARESTSGPSPQTGVRVGATFDAVGYGGCQYLIEPDASAASYWFGSNALLSGVTVSSLDESSMQGDYKFAAVVATASSGGTFDFSDISDTAQTMAAVAVFADSPTTVTGVEHMRHKECDRVSAVVTELRKLGIECDEHQDGYTIYPGAPVCKEPIETYDDHRMAMSFALLGLKVPGIIIKDPDCVNKTYPRFWDDWAKVTGKPVRRFTL